MTITKLSNPADAATVLGLPAGTTVTYTGDSNAIGKGTKGVSFPAVQDSNFIVLSTGYVSDISGASTGEGQGKDLGAPGPDGDAATVTFEVFVPTNADGTRATMMSFDLSLMSEEFQDAYAKAFYNDSVSLKVNGVEVALDPNGRTLDVGNRLGVGEFNPTDLMFDGQTTPMTISVATGNATKVTIELSIKDVGDGIYDSAVMMNNVNFNYPQVVYVDFDGGNISFTTGYAKGDNFTFNGLDPSQNTAAYRAAVLQKLNGEMYKDFNVHFTDQRPTSGEYATIMIGGAGDVSKLPGSISVSPYTIGLAEHIDVGNKKHSDVALVFTENYSSFPSAEELAQTIGHEMGHLMGLYHVQDASQVMFYAQNGSFKMGDKSAMRHDSTVMQDSQMELGKSVGFKPGVYKANMYDTPTKTIVDQGVRSFENNGPQVSGPDLMSALIASGEMAFGIETSSYIACTCLGACGCLGLQQDTQTADLSYLQGMLSEKTVTTADAGQESAVAQTPMATLFDHDTLTETWDIA